MVDTDQGLTITYNLLKDPPVDEPRIVELRRLHEEMDRTVLAAYGWDDVDVPPYETPKDDSRMEAFEDEVIDRPFVLNAEARQRRTLDRRRIGEVGEKERPHQAREEKSEESRPLILIGEEKK